MRKEVNHMKYQSPAMSQAPAVSLIQGSVRKGLHPFLDANEVEYNATMPAYEADE
jgi:hypothetical protein